MRVRVGNAPVSWAVETADDERNPPWQLVLDQIAQAGYRWIESGPFGYIPLDQEAVREDIAARGLQVIASFLYESLTEPGNEQHVAEQAQRTCSALSSVGARYLVVIDAMSPERMSCAGRSDAAERLGEDRFGVLMHNVSRVSAIAAGAGLRAVFHPHVGTYVEFEDEIDRFVGALPDNSVGLCLDTGHIAYAGIDPVALYKRYAERVDYFHFKDVDRIARDRVVQEQLGWDDAVAIGIFRPLGEGVVDFVGLRRLLDERNFDGWGTVEQDDEPGQFEASFGAACASLRFLEASGYSA